MLCVPTAPQPAVPRVSPSPRASLFPETTAVIEIRPLDNPAVASEQSGERKSCTSLPVGQELEMTKLSEEGMLKAEAGCKGSLLHQTLSQVVSAKESS